MLVVGNVGWSANLHPTKLTADEEYTHISPWSMLSAPLLLWCDLEHMDAFTLGLLTNDEVLAIDQDSLGHQAVRAYTMGSVDVYVKELEDGSRAVAVFNRGSEALTFGFSKLRQLGFAPALHVRDLWRQTDLPDITNASKQDLPVTVAAHGVTLYKLSPIE